MNVLFISPWYPHRYDSMAGLFVQKHAEAVSLYANVKVLYTYADETIKDFETIITTHNNIQEIRIYYPFGNKVNKLINYIKAYKLGLKEIGKIGWKPDIVQANMFTRTALVAYLLKKIYKIPYTVIEHWTRYMRENTFESLFHKRISVFAAKNAAAIMPVTAHLQHYMEGHGLKNQNYQVINNVVNDNFFKKNNTQKNEKVTILNVTSFDDDQKNITGILRTVERLSRKRTDFNVLFIGTGSDYERIVEYSKKLDIPQGVIFFPGLLEGDDLVEQYQKCDFTVLFSNYENIPVVISESFACGKPVISTDVGGINEHINSSNGILIPKGNENALEEALDHMIDHFREYDAEAIRLNAYEKYSFEKEGKHLFEIYQAILAHQKNN